MTSFFINLYKLLRAIWYGIKTDEDFRALLMILLTLLLSGTVFYWRHEGWSVIDAFYFSVMTISTTGYGDLFPSTGISKIFTVIYSLLGIGVFAASVTKIVALILEQKKKSKDDKKKTENISKQ